MLWHSRYYGIVLLPLTVPRLAPKGCHVAVPACPGHCPTPRPFTTWFHIFSLLKKILRVKDSRRIKTSRLWWYSGSTSNPQVCLWRGPISPDINSMPKDTVFGILYSFTQNRPWTGFTLQGLMLHKTQYGRVSFRDGSFYDDSLLWPSSSRTEHSRLVLHHCRNSSTPSLLSALLALFRCARVSSFSISVRFLWDNCDFPTRDAHQKDRKEGKNQHTVDVIFSLAVSWTTACAFFNKTKSDLIDIFPIIRVIFYTPNSLN